MLIISMYSNMNRIQITIIFTKKCAVLTQAIICSICRSTRWFTLIFQTVTDSCTCATAHLVLWQPVIYLVRIAAIVALPVTIFSFSQKRKSGFLLQIHQRRRRSISLSMSPVRLVSLCHPISVTNWTRSLYLLRICLLLTCKLFNWSIWESSYYPKTVDKFL